MTRTRNLATSLLSLSAAALIALGGAQAATASPNTEDAPSLTTASSTTASDADTAAYWTPERMRSAVPGDVLADKALKRAQAAGTMAAPVARGVLAIIAGSQSKVESAARTTEPQQPAPQTNEPQPMAQGKAPSGSLAKKVDGNESPVPYIGKVFFTLGGTNYVCSGNSVASGNKSTVSTAGHCVNEGPGAFATNFAFVPAYQNGSAPYGQWTAKALYTPVEWSTSGNIQYDTAFAVMNKLNGQSLSDVVGASGVQFNAARGLTYKSFGYPAAPPFNGETLKSCTGTATNDPFNAQFNTQGIPCNMTGGSSGGPWFIGTSSSGYQNSVNSYGYGSNSNTMYGPYWGSVIQQSYLSAAAAP